MANGIYVGSVYATFELNEKNVNNSVKNIQSSLDSVGSSMTNVGNKMNLYVTTPIAAGLGISTKLFGDFDKTMRLAAQTMGATGDEASRLRDLAKEMGATTAFSAQDAAEALYELAKGGMSVANIEGGVLKETLTLASAGGLQLGAAATYMTNALNLFGLSANDASRVSAALAGGANASTASVEDLGLALSQVGPGVKLLGYNVEDTVAVLAEFANVGIRGSDAGTSLKTMLQRLSPQTEAASTAMSELGLNFFDASGKALPLRDIAQQLQERLKGLTDEQKQNALTTIFGSDAYRAAAVLAEGGAAAVDKYTAATRDSNAANDLAKAATEGQAGALEKAKGSLETMAVTVGERLAPSVIRTADAISDLADKFGELSPATQDAIIKGALFLAALGPIITVAGNVVKAVSGISKVFVALGGVKLAKGIVQGLSLFVQGFNDARVAASAFSGVMGTLGGVARTLVGFIGPIFTVLRTVAVAIAGVVAGASALAIAIGVAIALVVAGLIWVAFHFEETKKFISDALNAIGSTISSWAGAIAQFFSPMINAIGSFFGTVGAAIAGFFAPIFATIGGVLGTIGNVFSTVFGVIGTIVSTVFGGIAAFWNDILAPIFSLIITIVTAVGTIFFTIFSGIAQIVFTVVSTIVQIIGVILYGTFMWLWNNVLVPTGKFFADVFNGIVQTVQTALGIVGDFITTVWNGIVAFLTPILQGIANFFVTIFNGIKDTITTVWNAVVGFLTPIVTSIVNFVQDRFNTLMAGIQVIFGLIKTYIINPVRDAVNFVVGKVVEIATSIGNAVSDAYNAVKNFVNNFVNAGKDLINGLVKGITGAKDAVVNKVKEIASGALDAVKSFFGIKSPSKVMKSMGGYIMEGFTLGIEKTGQDAIDAVQSVNNDMYRASQGGSLFANQFDGIGGNASAFTPRASFAGAGEGTTNNAGAFNLYGNIEVRNPISADELVDSALYRDYLEDRGLTK